MFYTGIDVGSSQKKVVSVFSVPWLRYYKILGDKEKGKKIRVVPSQRVLIKTLPSNVREEAIENYLDRELLRYVRDRKVLWLPLKGKDSTRICIVDITGFEKLEDFEAEPIALARLFLAEGYKTGEVWDIGASKVTIVYVKDGFITGAKVLTEFPKEISSNSKVVMLTGGGALNPEVKKLFKAEKVVLPKLVSPEKASACGAALCHTVGKWLPSFVKKVEVYTPEVLMLHCKLMFLGILAGSFGLVFLEVATPYMLKHYQKLEVELFKKKFPEIPAVAPLTQVKAMISSRSDRFYELLNQALRNLPDRVKLLGIYYDDTGLRVKVEVPSGIEFNWKGKVVSLKKLPDGTQIVEVGFGS